MCLAVPGKVVQWLEREPPFARAEVQFGGVRRQVSMDFVPEAAEGDYVLVHAGVAISQIDAQEAAKIFETLEEIARLELQEMGGGPTRADASDEEARF